MAGILEFTKAHQKEQEMAMNVIVEQWEVQFARCICFPTLQSLTAAALTHHPSLTPHSKPTLKRRRGGVWISTPSATVKFISDRSYGSEDAILMVSLGNKLMEEHYISRLHFSWPQVSCVSGFPARGTRAVILSYKDCEWQVQKFALRFSTIQETEKFINVVKEMMEGFEVPIGESNSGPSIQSEFAPCSELSYRNKEDCRRPDSADISVHQTTSNSKAADRSNALVNVPNCEANDFISHFPPSYSSFLMNCCPAAGKKNPRTIQEVDYKTEFAKYLEDASFKDLLVKVEKVITELGDNIIF